MSRPSAGTLKPLIPAWMDDAGWTVAEFRVYSHLCRREGVKGYAYPSIQSISENCRLHKDTVCRCLKALESRGYLKRVRKGGRSNRYYLFTAADALAAKQLPLANNEGRPLAETKGQVLAETKGQGVPETEGQEGIDRKETKQGVGPLAPNSSASDSEANWCERLQANYLAIDVAAELKKAARKKPGFERDWFERHWLPRCTPLVGQKDSAAAQAIDKLVYAEHCEEGMALFRARYPESDCESWRKVPIDQRKLYASEVVARAQANGDACPVSPKYT